MVSFDVESVDLFPAVSTKELHGRTKASPHHSAKYKGMSHNRLNQNGNVVFMCMCSSTFLCGSVRGLPVFEFVFLCSCGGAVVGSFVREVVSLCFCVPVFVCSCVHVPW